MIRFENVRKKFGDNEVLKGVTFSVKAGEILFILGTSGTGKSVTLKNIVGLLKPTSGEVWVDGENVCDKTEDQLFPIRKKCGMVFQHPALFDSITVFENVAFGLRKHFFLTEDEIKNRVTEALSLVNVFGQESKFPAELSYGTQKRVSLARTVALKPKILLFDEPTTGLDPISTNTVNFLIQDLSKKLQTTSIVVSHDMQCALAIADRIVVLDKGNVVEQGTVAEIKASQVPLILEFLEEAR
jgi:phospholipid/cholesterol/gamma-HCH transport system ATP-binding protein